MKVNEILHTGTDSSSVQKKAYDTVVVYMRNLIPLHYGNSSLQISPVTLLILGTFRSKDDYKYEFSLGQATPSLPKTPARLASLDNLFFPVSLFAP